MTGVQTCALPISLLNETRKRQFVDILSKNDHIPVYYPEDAELYLRAGRLPTGEIMAAAFNLSHDALAKSFLWR